MDHPPSARHGGAGPGRRPGAATVPACLVVAVTALWSVTTLFGPL